MYEQSWIPDHVWYQALENLPSSKEQHILGMRHAALDDISSFGSIYGLSCDFVWDTWLTPPSISLTW